MRRDEAGNPAPSTLGEYRDLCATGPFGEASEAVAFLDREIKKREMGREHFLQIPDVGMRRLLIPRLAVRAGEWEGYTCPCGEEIVTYAGPREPQPGDMMLCNRCGEVARYGPDLVLAHAPFAALDTVTQAEVREAQKKIAARRRG